MHSKTSTLSLPDHAPRSTSTVQRSQGLASQNACFPDHRYYATASGYGLTTIDVPEPQYLTSSTDDERVVSTFSSGVQTRYLQALQLQSYPTVPVIKVSLVVNQGWDVQDHASDHVTNHNATLSFPPTSLLPPYPIGRSSGYPQKNVNVSTSGNLDDGSTGPTTGLPSMRPVHGHIAGQATDSNVRWPGLSTPLSRSLWELHPPNVLTSDNVPQPPERIRTGMAAVSQVLFNFTKQLIKQPHLVPSHPTHSPYTCPIPSQSGTYSTANDNILFHPPFLTPNQISSSQSPQGHPGYLFTIHPHHTAPPDLPDMKLYTADTLDNHTAHIINDHSLPTLSDHSARIFGGHATHTLDDHTAGMTSVGGVDDYGKIVGSKCDSGQVASLHVQSSLPPKQFPLSPRELYSHDHLSRIVGRNLSGPLRRACRFATAQPRIPPKADRGVRKSCGWRGDDDRKCGTPITYYCADHFAAVHGLENIAWDVEIICRWCSSREQKKIKRKNILRHLREVHFCYSRSKNKIYGDRLCAGANDRSACLP